MQRPVVQCLRPSMLSRLCSARDAPIAVSTFLYLFGRRQHGLHAERLDPEFAAPALRVIKVFVLFRFDLFVRFLERLRDVAFRFLHDLAQQVPVQVVLVSA